MARTYEAILHGDHIDWTGEAPHTEKPLRVRVTVIEETSAVSNRGKRMADALAKLAQIGAFSGIKDPVAWQRQIRQDRPLPGREE